MGIVESGGYFLALETVTQLQGLVPFGVQHELCKTHICSVTCSVLVGYDPLT